MFVALSGLDKPHIDRMSMDGSEHVIHIVESGMIGPYIRLVYDQELDQVFWSDSGSHSISRINSQGRHTYPIDKEYEFPPASNMARICGWGLQGPSCHPGCNSETTLIENSLVLFPWSIVERSLSFPFLLLLMK